MHDCGDTYTVYDIIRCILWYDSISCCIVCMQHMFIYIHSYVCVCTIVLWRIETKSNMFRNTALLAPQESIVCGMKDMVHSIIGNKVIWFRTLNRECLSWKQSCMKIDKHIYIYIYIYICCQFLICSCKSKHISGPKWNFQYNVSMKPCTSSYKADINLHWKSF